MKKIGVLATMFWSGCVGAFCFLALATTWGIYLGVTRNFHVSDIPSMLPFIAAEGFLIGALASIFGGVIGWGISAAVVLVIEVALLHTPLWNPPFDFDMNYFLTFIAACLLIGAWIHSPLVPWRFLDPYLDLEKSSIIHDWSRKKRRIIRAAPLAFFALYWTLTFGLLWTRYFSDSASNIPRFGLVTTLRQSYRIAKYERGSRRPGCQSNLKQIGLGMMQYIQDYDELYPPAAIKSAQYFGWADVIQPYLKSTQIYQCPNEFLGDSSSNPRATNYTDYWYNNRFSSLNASSLTVPSLTIINGDGNDGFDATDARYSINALSQTWRNDTQSPIYRHLGGANYAFADGHVKWVVPGKVGIAPTKVGSFTFSPK